MKPLLYASVLFFLFFTPVPSYAITFQELPLELQFVALCESGGRHYSNGRIIRSKTDDVGIMQISEKYHFKTARSIGLDIFDPNDNMEYAVILYNREGLKPWRASLKCYKQLSYLSFIPAL